MKIVRQLKRFIWMTLLSVVLQGCFGTNADEGSTTGSFTVQFALDSVKAGLPLDSLHITISLGDSGPPLTFQVDLRSGKSTAQVEALEGQTYTLVFELFSAGYAIGRGESKGTLARTRPIPLKPAWNEDNIERARKDLGLGIILTEELAKDFQLFVQGKPITLPLDSLRNTIYRWSVKLGDSTLLSGEGTRVVLDFPVSLAGREVTVRVLALDGTRIKEERVWSVKILPSLPSDRLGFVRIRNDTSATEGASIAYVYEGESFVRIVTFPSIFPDSDAVPIAVESLFYEGGRLAWTRTLNPGGEILDSVFSYDGEGRLAALKVNSVGSQILDSLFYNARGLERSRRRVSGILTEEVRYHFSGPGFRHDSVFVPDGNGFRLTRLIENRFQEDSLLERRVFLQRDRLEAHKRERFVYNGLGSKARVQTYTESASLSLEQTDFYGYDDDGRLSSITIRDEVTGEVNLAVSYEYIAPPAIPDGIPAPKRVAIGLNAGFSPSAVLSQVRFSHEGWIFPRIRVKAP